jgi:hypothetical protein
MRHIPDTNNLGLMKWSRVSFQGLPMSILVRSLMNLSSNVVSENQLLFSCHYTSFTLCTNWFCVGEEVFCYESKQLSSKSSRFWVMRGEFQRVPVSTVQRGSRLATQVASGLVNSQLSSTSPISPNGCSASAMPSQRPTAHED